MPDSLSPTLEGPALQPITLKKRATAEAIHAELQLRIALLIARDEKFRGCCASPPRPIGVRNDGDPNWTVDGFPGLPSGCFNEMVKILDQARLEYELIE